MIFQLFLSLIRSETLANSQSNKNNIYTINIKGRYNINCKTLRRYKNIGVNVYSSGKLVNGACTKLNIDKLVINCVTRNSKCEIDYTLFSDSSIKTIDFSDTRNYIFIKNPRFLRNCNVNNLLLNSSKVQKFSSEIFSQFNTFHELYLNNIEQVPITNKNILSTYYNKEIISIDNKNAYVFNMYQLPKIVSYEKIIINSDMEISDYLNFKSFIAEEISITTNSQLIIRKGSFPDMENLKKLYIQSNSLVFEEGSIVNCKRLVDFKPKADKIVNFNANAIKNIRIEKFLIESNYYLNIGSFSDCSRLEQIELAEGTVAFTAGYFINCRRLKTVKTLCKGDDCMIYQDKSYLLKKINTSNLLEIVNSSELLFVNRGTKVAYVKNPFDLYSFTSLDSYSLKFYYDVPWDKLKEVCKVSDLRYIFGKNLTPPNRNQFKCNEKGCYVYCDKIEMHEEVSTPMPTIDIKLKDSAVESDNKKMKYSESSIITQIFTETLTQKAIVVASETLDENGSIIDTESTSYIIEGTYMNVEVVTQTLILIEFKENGDTTKSQISNGQLLALICGGCVIAFLVAFLGLFLYRRSHDKSDSEEEYSENEMEMEDDIGHVIYSDDERIISDEEIERINVL